MTVYKQLCVELLSELENAIRVIHAEDGTRHISGAYPVINRVKNTLAEPEPERLTVQEISDLPQHWHNYIAEDQDGEIQLDGRFSRADIRQLADSTPNNRSNPQCLTTKNCALNW